MAKQGTYVYEWPRPMVTADAAVLCKFEDTVKLLMIKRKNDPCKGCWALPGGFLELDEELETCAARELFEETGLSNVALEQLHTFGTIGRDPRGRLITVVYVGLVSPQCAHVKAGDDAAKAQWFPVDKLPDNMAFDHSDIARMATEQLRHRLQDTA